MKDERFVLYVCDRKRHCMTCSDCGRSCRHTTEEKHAKYCDHVEFKDVNGDGKFLMEVEREM